MYQKSQSHDAWFLRYGDRQTVILGHFFPFYLPPPLPRPPSNDPKYQNFEKNEKKCLEILSFYTYMCTINEDHIWFLKYKVRQTEIFKILGHFLAFQPLDNLENQNFNNEKKHLDILSFYTFAP